MTATTSPKGRKWIDRRIAQLDPSTDFAEIVRLSTLYRVNPLQLAWFYAVGTPAAGIAPAVTDAVWRHGEGTYNTQPNLRRDDSVDHLMMWFEHGPADAVTTASVGMVNKYHAHFARDFPQGFASPEDYVYILCLNATFFHSTARRLGMPGFSEAQQRATWEFWSRLAAHFTVATTGRPALDATAFPGDFDQMVQLVEDYQARPWPVHRPGHLSTTSAIENFARTWFPRPLRPFGRALVTTFLSPHVRRAHSIEPPAPPYALAARAFMWVGIVASTYVLPDPRDSILDRRRRASASTASGSGVDVAAHRRAGRLDGQVSHHGGLCPHLPVTAPTGD
ncbi:oxygenase MpaB family protein [Nocardioides zeae]|uniref:ER-bound oxygenase mpaB/mpaB'/Rubber oxygenase catalytic domain-containing protein n=1 Tax=Nocardioides zeae TaxID=1457234 RepID=A0AAJ1U6X5_9ACTN|nr:hypothetical protein [Nocardioides zeae]MDQ1105641.1 hypothetical protein [Nocardioides zeae]